MQSLEALTKKYQRLPDIYFNILVQYGGASVVDGMPIRFNPTGYDPLLAMTDRTYKRRNAKQRLQSFLQETKRVYYSLDMFATYLTTGYGYQFYDFETLLAVYKEYDAYLHDARYSTPPPRASLHNVNGDSGFIDERVFVIDMFLQQTATLYPRLLGSMAHGETLQQMRNAIPQMVNITGAVVENNNGDTNPIAVKQTAYRHRQSDSTKIPNVDIKLNYKSIFKNKE